MNRNLQHLNDLSAVDLRAWLVEALHDRVVLPKLSPDDAPDVAILAAEHTLDKPTRRDLDRACRDLVRDFTRSGEGDLSYLGALLHLASGLKQRELVGDLTGMARRFPSMPALEVKVRQLVLLTIIDLKEIQPVDFWQAMLEQDVSAYAGPALSGLLAQNWHAGLALLPKLPGDPMLAAVAAVIVDQTIGDLSPAERASLVSELERIAPLCHPQLRQSLGELLDEHRGAHKPQRTSPGLRDTLRKKLGTLSELFTPQPARLVPRAA